MDMNKDIENIRELPDKWTAAVRAGDIASLVDMFAEDAVRMAPDNDAVTGRQAIRSSLEKLVTAFDSIEMITELREADVAGDWGFYRCTYASKLIPKAGGEPVEMRGHWFDLLKRQSDGSWKIYRNIFNVDSGISAGQ